VIKTKLIPSSVVIRRLVFWILESCLF